MLKEAKTYVEQRSARATPDEKLAIVLDIDETSVSNWVNLATDDFGFFQKGECTLQPKEPCGFDEWIANQTPDPIKPTLDLFATAKAKAIKVFFISARREEQRADTVKNLIATGYKDWDDLILKQPNDPPSVAQFKTAARAAIEDKQIDHRQCGRSAQRPLRRPCRADVQGTQSVLLCPLSVSAGGAL